MWSVKEKELKAPLQVPMGATVQITPGQSCMLDHT